MPSIPTGFLTWEIGELEVARKINEAELSFYGNGLKGFIIGPHQRALIYSGGSLIAELSSGTYDVPGNPSDLLGEIDTDRSREGGVAGALRGAGAAITSFLFGTPKKSDKKEAEESIKAAERRRKKTELERYLDFVEKGDPLSLIITRSGTFNLDLMIDQVQTADVRTDLGVGLEVSMDDIEAFYREFMADTQSVLSTWSLQSAIADRVGRGVTEALASYSAGSIENNPQASQSVEIVIGSCIAPSFKVQKVGRVVVEHAEIQAIREEHERLALAEQKLPELIAANEFANRLNVVDLEKAKDDEEFSRLMQEVNKDKLLREEDMEVFQRTLLEQREDHEVDREKTLGLAVLARDQALALAQQYNQQAHEIAGLDHELDVTARRRAFERDETEKDLDTDRKKRAFLREEDELDDEADIRQLRSLQEVNNEKEDSELGRETARKRRDAELTQSEREQFANMSPEQIMLIRPDLDPEVVKGWVEVQKAKSGSEHIEARATQAAEAAEREIERNREMTDRMQQFMENQMGTITDLASGQASAKDKEIDRIQKSASETEERLSNVVGNTVDAFKGGAAEATVKGSQAGGGASETLYNVAVGKDDKGRHSLSSIAQQIAAGEFDPQSKVWCKGMDGWTQAIQVPEIADLIDSSPPPILDEEDAPPPL
ncbi:DUF4339 domain-containing protein [Akkermansiaceae bacterium]|nr:DUF4339 domain-containing protein [Akkermansiaceae bacterium]